MPPMLCIRLSHLASDMRHRSKACCLILIVIQTRRLVLFSFLVGWSGTSSLLLRPLLAYCSIVMDDDECGAIGGMLGRGNRSTRIKPAPMPLCPPQISHGMNLARTQAAAVGSRRLTAWATDGQDWYLEFDFLQDLYDITASVAGTLGFVTVPSERTSFPLCRTILNKQHADGNRVLRTRVYCLFSFI
jgi:hypothetical protein